MTSVHKQYLISESSFLVKTWSEYYSFLSPLPHFIPVHLCILRSYQGLTLYVPTPQNCQTHSNNSSAICRQTSHVPLIFFRASQNGVKTFEPGTKGLIRHRDISSKYARNGFIVWITKTVVTGKVHRKCLDYTQKY